MNIVIKNAKRDETNYLGTLRQFFMVKSVANRTNFSALKIIMVPGKTRLSVTD
jgi:hypothetical protein